MTPPRLRSMLDRLKDGSPLTDRERAELWNLAIAGLVAIGEPELGPNWDQRREER